MQKRRRPNEGFINDYQRDRSEKTEDGTIPHHRQCGPGKKGKNDLNSGQESEKNCRGEKGVTKNKRCDETPSPPTQ
jgi:hypothetical protein